MLFLRVHNNQRTFLRKPDWGELYWFDFGYPSSGQRAFAGVHPALVIALRQLILPGTALIIPPSSAEHRREGYLCHVLVNKQECPCLDKGSIVKVDQVYCVPTNELPDQYFIGTVPLPAMRRIYAELLRVLGAGKFAPTGR